MHEVMISPIYIEENNNTEVLTQANSAAFPTGILIRILEEFHDHLLFSNETSRRDSFQKFSRIPIGNAGDFA